MFRSGNYWNETLHFLSHLPPRSSAAKIEIIISCTTPLGVPPKCSPFEVEYLRSDLRRTVRIGYGPGFLEIVSGPGPLNVLYVSCNLILCSARCADGRVIYVKFLGPSCLVRFSALCAGGPGPPPLLYFGRLLIPAWFIFRRRQNFFLLRFVVFASYSRIRVYPHEYASI